MTLLLCWLAFAALAVLIILIGYRLALYGDIIGSRSRLGHSWVGTILLASATSLPELVTMLTLAGIGNADIAIADIFGSNVFNMLIIFILDMIIAVSIFQKVSKNHLISAYTGIVISTIVLLSFAIQALIGRDNLTGYSDNFIGYDTILVFIAYLIGMYILSRNSGPSVEKRALADIYRSISTATVYKKYALFALFIVITGFLMGLVGNYLSEQPVHIFGTELTLGGTLMGTIFFAIVTSLPELAVSISSVKIKSYDMAFGNILGSNIFNLAIIVIGELLYDRGPILFHCGFSQVIILIEGMIMMLIVIIGLKTRAKKTVLGRISIPSLIILLLYIAGVIVISKLTIGIN